MGNSINYEIWQNAKLRKNGKISKNCKIEKMENSQIFCKIRQMKKGRNAEFHNYQVEWSIARVYACKITLYENFHISKKPHMWNFPSYDW